MPILLFVFLVLQDFLNVSKSHLWGYDHLRRVSFMVLPSAGNWNMMRRQMLHYFSTIHGSLRHWKSWREKTNAKIWNSNTSWRISSHSLHFRLCNNKPAEHIQTSRSQMSCHRFSVILGYKTWHCSLFFALVGLCILTQQIFSKGSRMGELSGPGGRGQEVLSELYLLEGSKAKSSYRFGSFAAVDRKQASFEVPTKSTALPSSVSPWLPWGHSIFSLKDSCSPWHHRMIKAGKAL